MKLLTENEFDDLFTPIKNHLNPNASFDGCMFETYDDEIDFVISMINENRVVTIIDGDEDDVNDLGETIPNMYYASGYHRVNRIGYLILDKPFEFEFEVKLD